MARDIYVAETDEQAWAEAGPKSPAFGNWLPTTFGAAIPSRRMIFPDSPNASPIFREV